MGFGNNIGFGMSAIKKQENELILKSIFNLNQRDFLELLS
jgi:hypothetical protein